MAFLPNIPLATDQQSTSQANILNNFMLLGAIAGNSNAASSSINSSITNSGFNWIYLPPNSSTPPMGSSFPSGNIALYSALNSVTGQNELYINKQNQSTTVQIPATASTLSVTSAPASGTGCWTYLPSGLLLVTGNGTGTGLITTTFSGSIPAFTQILSVVVCPFNGSTSDVNFAVRYVDTPTPSTFRVYISSRTSTGAASGGFQYFVIGY